MHPDVRPHSVHRKNSTLQTAERKCRQWNLALYFGVNDTLIHWTGLSLRLDRWLLKFRIDDFAEMVAIEVRVCHDSEPSNQEKHSA